MTAWPRAPIVAWAMLLASCAASHDPLDGGIDAPSDAGRDARFAWCRAMPCGFEAPDGDVRIPDGGPRDPATRRCEPITVAPACSGRGGIVGCEATFAFDPGTGRCTAEGRDPLDAEILPTTLRVVWSSESPWLDVITYEPTAGSDWEPLASTAGHGPRTLGYYVWGFSDVPASTLVTVRMLHRPSGERYDVDLIVERGATTSAVTFGPVHEVP